MAVTKHVTLFRLDSSSHHRYSSHTTRLSHVIPAVSGGAGGAVSAQRAIEFPIADLVRSY